MMYRRMNPKQLEELIEEIKSSNKLGQSGSGRTDAGDGERVGERPRKAKNVRESRKGMGD